MTPAVRDLLLILGLSVLIIFLVLPPYSLLDKSYFVASGVCHRLPEHSLFFGEEQSPLCARCTGTYLGLLSATALLATRGRLKSSQFPPLKVSLALAVFVALWAIDGFNSFWTFWSGRPLLYTPSNRLRLVTGLLYGLCWWGWFVPLFNTLIFKNPIPSRSLENFEELGLLLTLGGGLSILVVMQWPPLLYPLALLSLAGPLLLLGAINSVLIKLIFNFYPEGIEKGGELLPLFAAGIGLSLVEISALVLVRIIFKF